VAQHVNILRGELVRPCHPPSEVISRLTNTHRCVKMSILALYYRIGYGRQGLPWIVQPRSVLITAGIMTAFSLSVSIVSTKQPHSHTKTPRLTHHPGAILLLHTHIQHMEYRRHPRWLHRRPVIHDALSCDQRGYRSDSATFPTPAFTIVQIQS
jgi:hypothetical protein